MNRWKASGLHLIISIVIAVAAVAAMLGIMYPWEYFRASGGFKLVAILLSVDIVIGPLLTLLVFKTGKPSLKFDLTCIGVLQLAALLYGMSVVIEARPVFLVHVGDRFHLVRASDLEDENLAAGREERFQKRSWTGPQLAVAIMPKELDRQQELMMSAIAGADLQFFPETYADYKENAKVVLEKALEPKAVLTLRGNDAEPIDTYIKRDGRPIDDFAVVPLKIGFDFHSALIDANSAEIIKILPVDPWE